MKLHKKFKRKYWHVYEGDSKTAVAKFLSVKDADQWMYEKTGKVAMDKAIVDAILHPHYTEPKD